MKPQRPTQELGFTLLELMVTVAIVGLLSAIAIPTFIKYQKKARTVEAATMLEKMYNGARVYYLGDSQKYPDAKKFAGTEPQFPVSEAMTPAGTCCAGSFGRCAPNAASWATATWEALDFAQADPHYYRYEFESSSSSGGALDQFYARAYGDLDCDGTLSTFTMYGEINADGNMSGRAALARVNGLE